MAIFNLMYGLCPLIFIVGGVLQTSASFQQRQNRAVSSFSVSKLQGEWYDIGRTTFIWGPDTWISQQWNFVQGQDGTLVALFNGKCKACSSCTDSAVFKVTEKPGHSGSFLLQGNGETLLFRVESDLQSEIVVSVCFADRARNLRRCPRSRLQVSVLSRQPVMKDVDGWTNIIRHLPVGIDKIDTSIGEGCPKLFIDPKLVRTDLVSDTKVKVLNRVGFNSRRSSTVLPCSLGQHASSLQNNTQVTWTREHAGTLLTKNDTVLKRANRPRLLGLGEGKFDLLLRGVGEEDVDVYTCSLEDTGPGDGGHVLLSRVAVSRAGFLSRPTIVHHSQDMVARKGETAVLECYANGNPPPFLTWWIKTPGAQEAYIRKARGGNKLRIRNVQASDEGVYKCEASSRGSTPVSALVSLHVGFPPETRVDESSVSVPFGRQVTMTCHVQIKSPDTLVWRKDGVDIRPDNRRSVSMIQTSEYRFELRLVIRRMRKEDFGRYSCFARDKLGESVSSLDILEQTYAGCVVNTIPVMENFNVQRFLGEMERIQSTEAAHSNQTYVSEIQGFFITVSGSLVHYHRGFSPEKLQCQGPVASSLVRLDTPGDYVFSLNGQRVRHKIVYTDYTHTITYTCTGGNDQLPCPRSLERVQILSRRSHIPDGVLQRLYGYVQQTCVPVTSLQENVPGICQMPADFMYRKGWIGKYPGLNCQVANLQTQGNLTGGHVTGEWQLIGEVKPKDYSTSSRSSLHIISQGDHLIRLYRSAEAGLCTATEADVLHKSLTDGSYYYDYKGRTVDSKILWVDNASLVLYSCLALKHDGTCYPGSELVELYHRQDTIDDHALFWLIRAVSNACVDVTRLVRVEMTDPCPVPQTVVKAAKTGLVSSGHTHIGCHQSLIAVSQDFTEEKLAGHWTVMYRNVGSLSDRSAIGQFSQSYHIIHRQKGELMLMIRHYQSDWELCPPTRVLQLKQTSGPGDYVHKSHSSSVVFKVLSVSEDTAVVYWCRSVGPDRVCRPDRLTVEVLARSAQTSISTERLQDMLQYSVDVCVTSEDMQPTSQVEKCTITEAVVDLGVKGNLTSVFDIPVLTCKNGHLKGEEKLNVEKLTGRWTVLWRNKEFWSIRAPFAESSYVVLTHYGLLYLWRSWNNDLHRCGPEEAGRFVITSGPGDYYSGFDGVPVAMKILKLTRDRNTMLAMWCHLDDDSRCHPHRTTIEVLSRSASLDNDTRDALFASVDLDCVSSPEWVPSKPDVCRVEDDVLTTAYIDGMDSVEYSKIGCHFDLIQGQAGVTDDMIIGSWHSVYQSNLSQSEGPAASVEFHFTKTAEGPVSLLYRLYSSDKKECLPARIMELTRDSRKPGTVFQLRHCERKDPYGFVYVLYADGEHLAVLLCLGVLKDHTCDPGTQNLLLLHKAGSRMWKVNQTLLDTVRGLGVDTCVDPGSLVMPTLDPCSVPEAVLSDASRGELEACSGERVQCSPHYIPIHPAFDIREFSGTWYTVVDTVTDVGTRMEPPEPSTYHFVPKTAGTMAMLFTTGTSGSCQPTQLRLLRAAEDGGQFYFTVNNTQEPYPVLGEEDFLNNTSGYQIGVMKVVWMDANMALTYWCFDINTAEPWCPSMDVALLSRQPMGGEEWELPAELRSLVADVCVSSEEFVTIDSEPCRIPGDIVSAVEQDDFAIPASFSVIQCAQQFVPTVIDFNMTQFSGVWHTVRQTTFMWGNATWQSLLRSYVVRDDHTVVMAFTGHPMDKGQCMPMDIRMLMLSNVSSQWTYTEGSEIVTVKVVWTDYNSSALLFTCKGEVEENGFCPRPSLQVELLSRSPNVTLEAMEVMGQLLPSLCVEEEEVGDVKTGMCQITQELEHLVEGGRRGEGASPVTACRVRDIPLEKNFTLTQMTGTWFEVARTRFTFNTMESVILVYDHNPVKHVLEGLFIGTLHKQCQSPLQSITRKKFADGPDSIIEGRIQVGESIFPWITFNILYYDGDMLMHLACYGENEDGTCPRDKTEVNVLGRSRQLTRGLEEKLDVLMQNVCLERADLVPTKETADCLPKLMMKEDASGLPDTSACKLDNIPVIQNLDEADLLGTWYGLGSVDYSLPGDPPGFVVSIQHSTPATLQWRQWNIRNGSCPGDKAVYIKAACSGSKTGDLISTKGSSFMLQWTAFKILRLQGELMLVYSCTEETFEGTCKPEGIHIDLLGRSTSATLDDIIPVLDALPSVCLKPESMKSVVSTAECDALASMSVPMVETSACAVDRLPAVRIDLEKVSGLWYEVAHTVDKMFPMMKAVIVYQALPGDHLAMYLTAEDPNGQCQGPIQGVMQHRCHGNPGPEFMGRLKLPGIWSLSPWRVLHVNYTRSLIGLSCMDEQRDGVCSPHGLKIHFLSRDPNPDADLRPQLYAILKSLNCFGRIPMEDVYHAGPSCKHKLDPILAPAA